MGKTHRYETDIGTNFVFGGEFVIKDRVTISTGFMGDLFEIGEQNLIHKDGGDGCGREISLKIRYCFLIDII